MLPRLSATKCRSIESQYIHSFQVGEYVEHVRLKENEVREFSHVDNSLHNGHVFRLKRNQRKNRGPELK